MTFFVLLTEITTHSKTSFKSFWISYLNLFVCLEFSTTVYTSDDMLRENLAAAIASCAPYGSNTQEFGRTVAPIVGYLVSKNPRVHRTTAMALQRLSVDPQNCITMHQVSSKQNNFKPKIIYQILRSPSMIRILFNSRAVSYHFYWKLLDQKIKNYKKHQLDVYKIFVN